MIRKVEGKVRKIYLILSYVLFFMMCLKPADVYAKEPELAYGEREGIIVINAADAMQNAAYALHTNKTEEESGVNTEFTWQITENPGGEEKGWEGHQGIQLTPVRTSDTGASWLWEKDRLNRAPSLTYKVYAEEAGDYYFSYYSSCPGISADSFHVGVNNGYQFKNSDAMTGGSDSNHAAAGAAWFFCDKQTLHLKAGMNTIQIWARESGICFRQFMLSKEKPMDARYLYFKSQKNTEWLEPSVPVDGLITMKELPDVDLEFDGKDTILPDASASNGNRVSYEVSSSTEHVSVSEVKNGVFEIKADSSGYATITVTAKAQNCADVKRQFFVNVAYKYRGQEDENAPQNLIAAPAAETKDSITIVWDKPEVYADTVGYNVYVNDRKVAERDANKTHYTAEGLAEDTEYRFRVEAIFSDGEKTTTQTLYARTEPAGTVINIVEYGASTSKSVGENTAAIQKAIDDCPFGGTVLVPEGTFLTGALDLKSHMTLQVEGELKGSTNPEDYLYPDVAWDDDEIGERIMTRYEGWEVLCHRSLINIGHLNWQNRYEVTCEDVSITGNGKITGGGTALRDATIQFANNQDWGVGTTNVYERTRGRLVSVVQSKNVNLSGVTLSESPCWTTHMIYSDTVTTHGMTILSQVLNGDGWDPDSSRNCMIFDTDIQTGDDCVAIKSGKNPEGDRVAIPAENIKIFDIQCNGGHGLAMGSEISGGINNVTIRDCIVRNTWYGLQLKGTPLRGGYISNLDVRDCTLNMLLIKSNVGYNADGAAAADVPYFQNLKFRNLVIEGKDSGGGALAGAGAIEVAGYDIDCGTEGHNHLVNQVAFEDIVLGTADNPHDSKIILENCDTFSFKNVVRFDGNTPEYDLRSVNKNIMAGRFNIAGGDSDTDIKIGDTTYSAPGPVVLPVCTTVKEARKLIVSAKKDTNLNLQFYPSMYDAENDTNERKEDAVLKDSDCLAVTVEGETKSSLYQIRSGLAIDITEFAVGKDKKDAMTVGEKLPVAREKLNLAGYDYAAENATTPYNVEFSTDASDSVYFQASQVPAGASFEFTEPFEIKEDGKFKAELYYKRNTNRGTFRIEFVSTENSGEVYILGSVNEQGSNQMDTLALNTETAIPAGTYTVRFVCEASGTLTASRLYLTAVPEDEEIVVPEVLADFSFDEKGQYFDGGNAKAAGAYELVENANGKALRLNGTNQFLNVTAKDGKSLLTGVQEMTVSFQAKPEGNAANWAFFAAPNAGRPEYLNERYLGLFEREGALLAERYHNAGQRPAELSCSVERDKWYYVTVVFAQTETIIYIDGVEAARADSAFSLPQILGDKSILYIGKATWGTGEYYRGLIDNYKIVSKALTAEQVAAEVQKQEDKPTLPYIDVAEDDWFYDGVYYNYFAKTMTGKDKTHFAPYENLARAQFAVILYRMEGAEAEDAASFPDVPAGMWYSKEIKWASDAKVVTGYSSTGTFGPADNILREQMAVMMYRYAKLKGYDVSKTANYSEFTDGGSVTGYAEEAMKWAVGTGIITGKDLDGDGTKESLDPLGNTSRAEASIIIQRFMENYPILL